MQTAVYYFPNYHRDARNEAFHGAGWTEWELVDFISGTTYALNGEIKKVGHNVFLCAPSNVNVSYTEEEKKVSAEMPWLKK